MTDREYFELFNKLYPEQLYLTLKPDKSPKSETAHLQLIRFHEIPKDALVGWEVPKEYVIVDFDTASQAAMILRIVQDMKLNCLIFKTRKGFHFGFKNHRKIDFSNDVYCGLGFKMDVRTNMKGYIMLPYNDMHNGRDWVSIVDNIDRIPSFLVPLKSLRECPDFMEVDSGNRNAQLFKHVVNLIHFAKEISPDEKSYCISTINKYLLKDPLTSKELDQTVLRSDLIKAIQTQKARDVTEEEYAVKMLNDNSFTIYNDAVFRFNDKFYEFISDDMLHTFIHEKYTKNYKQRERNEVINFIKVKLRADTNKPQTLPWHLLAVKNGILNVKTGELLPFNKEHFCINQLPVNWIPDDQIIFSKTLFDFIDNAANCDAELRTLFFEIIASCLVDTRLFDKFFVLLGEGGTGKSTFLNIIDKLLGTKNVSHLTIHELNHQFLLPELSGKKANLGDDVEHTALDSCANLKKLVANQPMEVARKYEQPFTLINTATMIFTANKMMYISERTSGIYRRLMIIPMNVKIKNMDFEFVNKLTDNDLEYLLNRSINALQNMLIRNSFTEPLVVKKELATYIRQQSNTLTFVYDRQYNADKINKISVSALYEEYKHYCFDAGYKPAHRENFMIDVTSHFDMEVKMIADINGSNITNRFIKKEVKNDTN